MSALRLLWWAVSVAVALFLVAPLLVIVPLSFSEGSFLHFPLPGVSLRWYHAFFASEFWLASLWNSLVVGLSATAIATALGTLAAVGLWLAPLPGASAIMGVLLLPMVVPSIITAVALTFAYAPVGLASTHLGLIIAHAALASPFVVVTVGATLTQFDRTLLRAAAACGAGPVTAFRRVMLPLILPGVVAGAVFAFATSLDESVVVLFLAGPSQRTLPRQMFAGLKDTIELTILAAATMLTVLSLVLMLLVRVLSARGAAAGRP
ncbi:ABC transporter permease [Elioraea tepida]|uniref:ABC transporter permease n=1 Tax=Elioraea tepida TaxID=2843330 RepID=A0A975TZE5_9PROT|nr:ABC transporter permease [Elioraea tepida]QXM23371.1 ABC transporter permease [Elioraea tepida]